MAPHGTHYTADTFTALVGRLSPDVPVVLDLVDVVGNRTTYQCTLAVAAWVADYTTCAVDAGLTTPTIVGWHFQQQGSGHSAAQQ